MKKYSSVLVLIFAAFISSTCLMAKEKSEKQKTSALDLAIDNKSWVLEANEVICHCKRDNFVEGHINFISINNGKAVIQVGKNYENNPGSKVNIIQDFETNHVGGLTIEGEVVGYKVKEHKKGNKMVFVQVNSVLGSVEIRMDYNYKTNIASAHIKGNSFARIQYIGDLVAFNESSVFKGREF